MKTQTNLALLEERIGYSFRDKSLLREALTHSSFCHESGGLEASNERMEFIGDAVLDLAITEKLMELFRFADEGNLSRLRSRLVSEQALSSRARTLGLGEFLRLGKGEDRIGGRERSSLLADALEAVLAAQYWDGGYPQALKFVEKLWGEELTELRERAERGELKSTKDSKTQLQEFLQAEGFGTPQYRCLNQELAGSVGPFEMGLFLQNIELMRIMGATKKEATNALAEVLMQKDTEHLKMWIFDLLKKAQSLNPQPSTPNPDTNLRKEIDLV